MVPRRLRLSRRHELLARGDLRCRGHLAEHRGSPANHRCRDVPQARSEDILQRSRIEADMFSAEPAVSSIDLKNSPCAADGAPLRDASDVAAPGTRPQAAQRRSLRGQAQASHELVVVAPAALAP